MSIKQKIPRALSFEAQLQQKLNTILRAYGTRKAAAAACGVCVRAFYRWVKGLEYPSFAFRPKLDEAYYLAAELLEHPDVIKKAATDRRKVRSLSKKLRLSEDTIRLLQEQGFY